MSDEPLTRAKVLKQEPAQAPPGREGGETRIGRSAGKGRRLPTAVHHPFAEGAALLMGRAALRLGHTTAAEVTALCPEVPRPALALFMPGEGYVITDPLADSRCQTTLAGDTPGLFQVAGNGLYYAVRGDAGGEAEPEGRGSFAVKQVGQDGRGTVLPFTTIPFEQARLGYQLRVSVDQRLIAWSAGYVPYEALTGNDGLRFPQAWFGTTHVVVDYVASPQSWGAALIGLDGTVIEVFAPDAPGGFVAVLPAVR